MLLLVIQCLRVGIKIRKHPLGIHDRLSILIWLSGIDIIVVQELRRLDGLSRVLRLSLQVGRIGAVVRRWIAHRPGTQMILIEYILLMNRDIASSLVCPRPRSRLRSSSKDRRVGETAGRSGNLSRGLPLKTMFYDDVLSSGFWTAIYNMEITVIFQRSNPMHQGHIKKKK